MVLKLISKLMWPWLGVSAGWSIVLYTKESWVSSLVRHIKEATDSVSLSHRCFSLSPPPSSLSKINENISLGEDF